MLPRCASLSDTAREIEYQFLQLKDHEVPKLSASTLVTYDGDFAKRLDLAIERANGHKLLDHAKVIEHAGSQQHPASEIAKPLPPRLGVPLRRRA